MGGSGLGFFCPRVGFVQVLRVCSGFVGLFGFLIDLLGFKFLVGF